MYIENPQGYNMKGDRKGGGRKAKEKRR